MPPVTKGTKLGPRYSRAWPIEKVLALPAVVTLVEAGAIVGMRKDAAYAARARGAFPFDVITLGPRYMVTKGAILAALNIDAQGNPLQGLPLSAVQQSPAA